MVKRGYKQTPDHIAKRLLGENNPMHNKKHTKEAKQKNREAHLGEKSSNWKADRVGYIQLHKWIRRNYESPGLCEECHLVPPRDLANVTGVYDRDFKNWKYLCRRCHKRLDLKTPVNAVCTRCNSDKTYFRKERDGVPRWRRIDNNIVCGKCYSKYLRDRKKNIINSLNTNTN